MNSNEEAVISIIVPVYNAEKFLDRCIQSVIDQTWSNWKLILVEDCSADGSREVCRKWSEKDERIELICHEKNGGAAAARNTGLNTLDFTDGYIAFLDSDDYLHPKYLESLFDLLQRRNADISWVSVHNTFEKKKLLFPEIDFNGANEYELTGKQLLMREDLRIMYCMVWGKLFKSKLWEKIRFSEDYHFYEDGATTFKVLYEAHKVAVSDLKLYNYFYSEDSATRSRVSRVKLYDGLRTEEDKITFYTEKREPQLVRMAYVAYLTTVLKIMRDCDELPDRKEIYREMRKLYRRNYMKAVKNPDLSKGQRIKYVIYRFFPGLQKYYIHMKMKKMGY
ncbi:Glycosyltransferase involved in cell wall bisynthesis [Lachnospiraceae bacterium]|nr:Glycosyltransferase involved in cell wall bisynthesis [Lachnospiraceae bacterium]